MIKTSLSKVEKRVCFEEKRRILTFKGRKDSSLPFKQTSTQGILAIQPFLPETSNVDF